MYRGIGGKQVRFGENKCIKSFIKGRSRNDAIHSATITAGSFSKISQSTQKTCVPCICYARITSGGGRIRDLATTSLHVVHNLE